MKQINAVLITMLTLLVVGCAVEPPSKTITQVPKNDISLAEVLKVYEQAIEQNSQLDKQQTNHRFDQSIVRWGGRILQVTEPAEGEAGALQIEIIEYPLDEQGRPVPGSASAGHFIASIAPIVA